MLKKGKNILSLRPMEGVASPEARAAVGFPFAGNLVLSVFSLGSYHMPSNWGGFRNKPVCVCAPHGTV